jgi:hypothetical protein
MDTDEFIATTMRRVAASAVAPTGEEFTPAPGRRRIAPLTGAGAIAGAAVAAVTILAVATLDHGHHSSVGPTSPTTSTFTPSTVAGCRVDYPSKLLPRWARAGFTPAATSMPFVLGDRGDIAAIVWASHHPLVAPPSATRNNKILWVARVGASEGPLRIRATSASTGHTVTRTVQAAPGPSIIDLPSGGCWSFDLRWGSHQDHLVLGYAPR